MRRLYAAFCLLAAMSLLPPVFGGSEEGAVPPFVADLLELDAPTRAWEGISEASQRAKPKFDPLEELRRCIEHAPVSVARCLSYVEPDASAIHHVARLADGDADRQTFGEEWHEKVDEWLATWRRRVLPEYRGELVVAASELRYGTSGIAGASDLVSLAEVDWHAAQSVLNGLRTNRDPRVRSYATAYLYERSTEDARARLRIDLQTIAQTRSAPGYARHLALKTLLRSEWAGRNEWFLSLFEDSTLLELREGSYLYRPLNSFVWSDADRWIPRVAKMVGGASRAAHDNAVSALVQFHLEHKRADALKPLLPWLADPSWSSARDRLRLLQSLDDLNMPESVPGLLVVIENESGWPLRAAASAIEKYEATEAVPVLRKALFRAEPDVRKHVFSALHACGGLDLEARVAAREAHALRLARSDAGNALGPESETERLGALLAEREKPPIRVANVLMASASALEPTNPVAARQLRDWVGPWPRIHPYRVLLQQLKAETVEPQELASKLRWRRTRIAEHFGEELDALIKEGGVAGGCAAVMLDDAATIESTLSGTDREAQMGLLACARMIRLEIDLSLLENLYESKHAGLAKVADEYLLALDTPEAREAVLARHRGAALIVGARGYNTHEWEDRLRKEVLASDGPREVIALLSFGAWGPQGQVVIRVRGESATLTFHHREREDRVRDLPAHRLSETRDYLASIDADSLPAYRPSICDGVHYTFLRVTREGGYRIYMNNPGTLRDEVTEDVYARLTRFMRREIWRED